MKREVSLEEISDGRLYRGSDMVKADCRGCAGCHACCTGMGRSVILDPLDAARLSLGLGASFDSLLGSRVELNVVDGIVLPNLKMEGEEERCSFLGADGRCTVHPYRPGLCRLFPLGRYYGEDGFSYFLQIHECPKRDRTKVKVHRWIDTPEPAKYEDYICRWHFFLKALEKIVEGTEDEALARNVSLYVLKVFYRTPYSGMENFYSVFEARMEEAERLFQLV